VSAVLTFGAIRLTGDSGRGRGTSTPSEDAPALTDQPGADELAIGHEAVDVSRFAQAALGVVGCSGVRVALSHLSAA
jgi:hypothetical protein